MNHQAQSPTVSVMIPYYNCKEYIVETIQSVLSQSHQNFEIIIVDDGSDPEHADYLKGFLADKPAIRYAVQNNQGVAAARNHAARLAGGKYFLFLDSDDLILPDYIEKCVTVLENNPDCKLVYPLAEYFDAQEGLWNLPDYDGLESLLKGNRIPIISMHRAEDFVSLGGFDENLTTHEDWDLWIRLLSNGGTVIRIPEVLFRYRKRRDGSSLINRLEQNPDLNREDWQKVYEKNRVLFMQYHLGYSDCIQKISLLEQQIQSLSELNLQLREDNTNMQNQNQELQHVMAKLLQQTELSAKQTESLQQQIDMLMQLMVRSQAAEEQSKEQDKQIELLKKQIDTLQQEKQSLEHTIHTLNENRQSFEQTIHGLNENRALLEQHIRQESQRLAKYKGLWTVKVFKPFVKTEQAISSANRYRKGFRLLVREKGSIGKAYQFLRRMYKANDFKAVKMALRGTLAGTPIFSAQIGEFDITNKAAYQEWIKQNDTLSPQEQAAIIKEIDGFAYQPKISVLMPVYNVDIKWLEMAVESVKNQFYGNWELCISDDASPNADIRPLLERYSREDSRIKVVFREQNGHISENSNSALALCSGEWIALMDHDDLLPQHALFEVVKTLQTHPDAAMVYSDEDKVDESGMRFMPHFKSDFNPDLLYGQNYISHLGVYRTDIAKAIGGFRKGLEGSQDYDFLLRYLLRTDNTKVIHIPKILYHWRAIEGSTALASGEKSYTTEAGIKALQNYFAEKGENVTVTRGKADNLYRVRWHWGEQPLVSLIIPTRNGYAITKQAIDSILDKTTYTHYEILLVDNNSDDPQALAYFDEIAQHEKVRLLRYPYPFNYSAINNFAVKHAKGSIIGLINNDVEVIDPEWLDEMVAQAQRPQIGCVGAMLYYPNDTVQHAGVFIGINGVAAHSHKHYIKKHPGYFSRLYVSQNLMAVTAACLLVRKEVFEEVGGLNEQDLTVAFNDVDFCLKVHTAGYRNLWTPYAQLYHHESISRGYEDNPEKQARFKREIDYMVSTWQTDKLQDPYYNPNLTLRSENFSIDMTSRVKR